jgi:hypothetical protein
MFREPDEEQGQLENPVPVLDDSITPMGQRCIFVL